MLTGAAEQQRHSTTGSSTSSLALYRRTRSYSRPAAMPRAAATRLADTRDEMAAAPPPQGCCMRVVPFRVLHSCPGGMLRSAWPPVPPTSPPFAVYGYPFPATDLLTIEHQKQNSTIRCRRSSWHRVPALSAGTAPVTRIRLSCWQRADGTGSAAVPGSDR